MEGRQEGAQISMKRGKAEVARMKQATGIALGEIAKLTGLSLGEVKQICH
jgi:predicted transposase YdaD